MADRRENVKRWKLKCLIKSLEEARGHKKSLFSLIIPSRDPSSFSRAIQRLEYEHDELSADHWAIESALKTLKLMKKPPYYRGLVLYTGKIFDSDGLKEKEVTFEPFIPINTSVFVFDSKFHTTALTELVNSGDMFGIMVMDRVGVKFGRLKYTNLEVVHDYKFCGEDTWISAYRKAAELAGNFYIDKSRGRPNIQGLILAGEQQFLDAMVEELNPRLKEQIVNNVQVSHGGNSGFNEAINKSCDSLMCVRFMREKRLLQRFFAALKGPEEMFVFGLEATMNLIPVLGCLQTLIVWEKLDAEVYVMKNEYGKVELKRIEEEGRVEQGWELLKKTTLIEWLANEYTRYSFAFEIITDSTQEGLQFCKAFEGIGGILLNKLPAQSEGGEMDSEGESDNEGESDGEGEIADEDFCFW